MIKSYEMGIEGNRNMMIYKDYLKVKRKRYRSKRKPRIFTIITIAQILFIVVLFLYFIVLLEKNRLFYIEEIIINCNNNGLKAELEKDILKVYKGRHILSGSLMNIKNEILSNNSISALSMEYSMFPLTLKINVYIRTFWAKIITGEKEILLDYNGERFIAQGNYDIGYIPIYKENEDSFQSDQAIENIHKLHVFLQSLMHIREYRVDILYSKMIADEFEIIIPNIDIFNDGQLKKIRAIVEKSNPEEIKAIDLRFRDQAVIKRRG